VKNTHGSYATIPFFHLRLARTLGKLARKSIRRQTLFVADKKVIRMSAEKDQEFLEYVIKAIVDHSEEVVVNRSVDEMGVLLTLKVHREDMGKVIGRSGNTAKAVRTLLRVVGMKYNARVNLKIEEPDGGRLAPAEGGASVPTMKTVDEAMADLQL